MRRFLVPFVLFALAAAAAQQTPELKQRSAAPTPQLQDESPDRAGSIIVPAGTQIPLKLAQAISTKNAKPGDPVYAETAFPIVVNDHIVIPAGTYVQGRIAQVKRPGRVKGNAEFLMHFTTLVYKSGYTVMLPGAVEQMPGSEKQHVKDKEGTIQQDSNKGKDAGTVASTAGTGAMVGGIADRSLKGAALGGAAGAGAGMLVSLLTRGPDVNLPEGTSVQMVLQRPLTVQSARIQ